MRRVTMRPKQAVLLFGTVGVVALFCMVFYRNNDTTVTSSGLFPSSFMDKEYLPSDDTIKRLYNLVTNGVVAGKGDTKNVKIEGEDIIRVAKRVASYNKTVLVTMVNDAYLPFTYSWLCNTKDMGIHKSVLIITTDEISKTKLERDWPEISVVAMNMNNSGGDQVYSHAGYVKIMVKRTEMLLQILMADLEIFLFEVDCLWLANPTPVLQKLNDVDILVNPVAGTTSVFAGGFLYLFATPKAKALWTKVTEMMINLGERLEKMKDNQPISEGDNDQQYFSKLINERYGDVRVKILPLDEYADGKWYSMTDEQRKKLHPYIVNNNWVLGNQAKITRAKEWQHWFVKDDLTCDMDLVRSVVYH